MPTTLGIRFPRTWEGTPPHMSQEDTKIWRRYKPEALKNAISIYFDVGLGGQTEVPPDTSPEMARMWLRTTQKRIDVLIEEPGKWIIIELRPHASSTAIGRLLQYLELWKQDPPDTKPVELRLITDITDQDTKKLAETLSITFIAVPL